MISRRNLIAAAGTGALLAHHTVRAKDTGSTRTFIAQAAHLTVDVPSHWAHTPPQPYGAQSVRAEDGFFVAVPNISPTTSAVFSTWFDVPEADVTETHSSWRDMDAIWLSHGDLQGVSIPNPNPILTFGGSADYLFLMGDSDHFDAILETLVFGLEDVSRADLAASILDLIKAHSFFREDVSWSELYDRAAEIESDAEIVDYLQFTVLPGLRSAGDNHSFLRNMDGLVNIATPTVGGQSPFYPTGDIIEGYGYINFPSTNMFTSGYQDDYARIAAELRNDFHAAGVCGWIIDLRIMGGGSVSPLLTALYPFLPDGKIAGFLDAYGNETWIEKTGQRITPAAYNRDIGDVPWPEELADPAIPVAVLTGPNNGSAGEFVQLALMSRDNLLTFGLASAGYTTGNIGLQLYNSYHMGLASTAELDVHGNVYTGKIEPDVEDISIGGRQSVTPANISTALEWLDQQCATSI